MKERIFSTQLFQLTGSSSSILRAISIFSKRLSAIACLSLFGIFFADGIAFAATLNVNPQDKKQTWRGWEISVESYHRPNNVDTFGDTLTVPSNYNYEKLDLLVNDLGVTALRFELMIHLSGGREAMEPVNDNGDPFVLDQSKIYWNYIDPYIREVVIPFRDRVRANGEPFYLVLSSTAWNAWQWNSPEEYAEIYMAGLNRLRTKYGIIPDALILYNEPDNPVSGGTNETFAQVFNAWNATVNRLDNDPQFTQLPFRFPAASTIAEAHNWMSGLESFQPAATATKLLNKIQQMDFHGYGGFQKSALNSFRSRAVARNADVVMGEYWFADGTANANHIVSSLVDADATIYQGSAEGVFDIGPIDQRKRATTKIDYYPFRSFYRFIRPGDVRIGVTSNDSALQVVAFENPQGRHTVAVRNTSGSSRTVSINGLASGTYGVSVTTPSQNGVEQSPINLSSGNALYYGNIPGDSIVTFYGRNQLPGTLQFSAASYTADESVQGNNESINVMVTRRNGVNGPVSVRYATSNGLATAGSDYLATSGTLNFADGETTKTFTINILHNNPGAAEGNESINLQLSNPAGGASLGSNQATLWIRDLDGGVSDSVAPGAPRNLTVTF